MKRISLGSFLLALLIMITVCMPFSTFAAKTKDTKESIFRDVADSSDLLNRNMVVDAARYRGVITDVFKDTDGVVVLELKQVEGIDFGTASLKVRLTKDTRVNVKKDMLKKGIYVEAYYGSGSFENEASSKIPEKVDAIVLNYLYTSESTTSNILIKKISFTNKDRTSGKVIGVDMKTKQEKVFNFSDQTAIYLNWGDIKANTKVHVLHLPTMTASEPPQLTAVEISIYS